MKRELQKSRLAELPGEIQRELTLSETHYSTALEHAIAAGRLLLEAKAAVPHGEWTSWLGENVTVAPRTAQGYMQLAREPEANARQLADFGVRQALKALAKPRPQSLAESLRQISGQREPTELAERPEGPDVDRFPRPGVERRTVREVEEQLHAALERLDQAKKWPELVPAARADLLREAASSCAGAEEDLRALIDSLQTLADFVRRAR